MSIAISIFKEASGYIIFNFIKTDGRSCTISPALLDNFGQNLFWWAIFNPKRPSIVHQHANF